MRARITSIDRPTIYSSIEVVYVLDGKINPQTLTAYNTTISKAIESIVRQHSVKICLKKINPVL